MSAHAIGAYNFEFWESQPPLIPQNQVNSYTRPGVASVGHQRTGKRNRQFEAIVVAHYSTYALAMAAQDAMATLAGNGPLVVVYNNIDYLATFGINYTVEMVEPVDCNAVVRLLGPTYDFLGGAELRMRFMLTPV